MRFTKGILSYFTMIILPDMILLISITYTLATLQGAFLQPLPVAEYICRPTETGRSTERYSTFWMGLHAPDWGQSF
jgi:hypothetical protein